jgi:nicotinamidase-related amidase
MQRIWLEPGLDPHHADWDADHYFYVETRERVIPNHKRLLAAARSAGIEVIHTIIQSLTEDGRDRSLDHKLTPIHVPPSLPEGLPPPELSPVGDEILLPKTSSGVFNSTNLDYLLKNLGIQHLVVAGILTDQCVDMAVRDGADRGYLVADRFASRQCATRFRRLLLGDRHDDDRRTLRSRRRVMSEPAYRSLVTIATTDFAAVTRGRPVFEDGLERAALSGIGWTPANISLTPLQYDRRSQPVGFGRRSSHHPRSFRIPGSRCFDQSLSGARRDRARGSAGGSTPASRHRRWSRAIRV